MTSSEMTLELLIQQIEKEFPDYFIILKSRYPISPTETGWKATATVGSSTGHRVSSFGPDAYTALLRTYGHLTSRPRD